MNVGILVLWPCVSFSGNICFEFSLLCLCSVVKVTLSEFFWLREVTLQNYFNSVLQLNAVTSAWLTVYFRKSSGSNHWSDLTESMRVRKVILRSSCNCVKSSNFWGFFWSSLFWAHFRLMKSKNRKKSIWPVNVILEIISSINRLYALLVKMSL